MKLHFFRTPALLVLVLIVLPAAAIATITQITINPDGVPLGHWVQYTITANGPSADYSFRYRCEEGAVGAWAPPAPITGAGNVYSFLEDRVGAQTMMCGQDAITNYLPYTHVWNYLTKSFTVVGPDSETITSGLGVNSTGVPSMEIDVYFRLKCAGAVMGMMIDGDCQRRTRRPPVGFDSGWLGPDAEFSLGSGSIRDHKTSSTSWWAFSGAAVGDVFDDYYQQNRIRVKDCSGGERIFYFSDRHFQKIKTGTSTWKLIEI